MTPPPPRAAAADRRWPSVDDDSRKIHKSSKRKPPVVIYMVSPEVIHVEASEFMALVQRLTGPRAAAGDGPSASVSRQVLPLRVKAVRELTRRPPTAAQTPVTSSGGSETLFFHDLSPPSTYAVRKDEQMATPHGWLQHGESSS
ncbi:uncharacterized protein LOC122000026 [Zingiber officinale]|uniref:VQ domain-containing protein n=1 Tax=Zingiber officinale TaxID=94328 RepID=A0A8J5FNY2_ZINOF|nr:uncharacterized protein LOC122000026 [Zingiber officinale]KAG6492341.1 hypothetical protein ZIOFF_047298 [Zingiber officinale]